MATTPSWVDSLLNKRSADGQEEQDCEVNSSASTAPSEVAAAFGVGSASAEDPASNKLESIKNSVRIRGVSRPVLLAVNNSSLIRHVTAKSSNSAYSIARDNRLPQGQA